MPATYPFCYISVMILRFYNKLDLIATPGTEYKMSLMDVPTALGVLQDKLAKYFVDQSEFFEPCGYLDEDLKGEYNFKLLTVFPMPVLHHSQPAICWVVHIAPRYDTFKTPFDLQKSIHSLAEQINGQLSDGWGEGFEQKTFYMGNMQIRPKCSSLYSVEWSGCWCDGASIIPFISCGLSEDGKPTNSLVFKNGWVEHFDLDDIVHYIVNDWTSNPKTAVRDAQKHVVKLMKVYVVSAKFIECVLLSCQTNHWGSNEKLYQRIVNKLRSARKPLTGERKS